MAVKDYRELIVWRKAMDFVVAVYRVTRVFPRDELYGLTNQLRRAAVSVSSNIAEGQGRCSDRAFCRFLSIADGSLREAETEIEIAARLTYIDSTESTAILEQSFEIGRLLNGLSNTISCSLSDS